MTQEQALAMMMARAKPLLHELWYLDKCAILDTYAHIYK